MKYFVGVKKNNKSDIFKTNKKNKHQISAP